MKGVILDVTVNGTKYLFREIDFEGEKMIRFSMKNEGAEIGRGMRIPIDKLEDVKAVFAQLPEANPVPTEE